MFSFCRARGHVLQLLLLFIASTQAYFLDRHFSHDDLSSPHLLSRSLESRAISNTHGVPLRILCLGASITYGFGSTNGNGYRYALRGKLIADGNDVNMIGVASHGNMRNNLVDGFPGMRIDQVSAKKNLSLTEQPNVVLIELGTNDMTQNYSVATAHIRMGELVGRIANASPNVTVLLATLLPNANPKTEANILIFNHNLISTVANLTAQKYRVSMVDFHSDWWSLADIGPDGTHPTDLGYLKMSRLWYNGIVEAANIGDITAPKPVAGVDDYAAKNDTSSAHTAMNVVCQNVNGSLSAQVQACSGAGRLEALNIAFIGLFMAGAYTLF